MPYSHKHEDRLIRFYGRWLKRHSLPVMSADELHWELLHKRGRTTSAVRKLELDFQTAWLTEFMMLWHKRVNGVEP